MKFFNFFFGIPLIAVLFSAFSLHSNKLNDDSRDFIRLYKSESVCATDITGKVPCGVEWHLKNSHEKKSIAVLIESDNSQDKWQNTVIIGAQQDFSVGCSGNCTSRMIEYNKIIISSNYK